MCTVSMVYDFARTIPQEQWTRPQFGEFQDLIRRLDEIDRKLGLADCADPEKAKFLESIEKRLKAIEDQL